MWLINTSDFTLRDVVEPGENHAYAILSHTWDESDEDPFHREVTFKDMQDLTLARQKTGWVKIEHTCALAKGFTPSLEWAWIDTCCIDKSSSAELSEAINSMFQWYQSARVCFVYLSDLPRCPSTDTESQASLDQLDFDMPRCRWFTRGWTLQELIAPYIVEFYDNTWTKRGTKRSLMRIIHNATGIDSAILEDPWDLFVASVAQRMSWASQRKTQRLEDMAYSLFGIFDVNMPLIYGEGSKAFLRLQEAIAQQSNDMTLFAWSTDRTQTYHGMFAYSPRDFKGCSRIVSSHNPLIESRQNFTLTNRGLLFQAGLLQNTYRSCYYMKLHCYDYELERRETHVLCVPLVKTIQGFARYGSAALEHRDDTNCFYETASISIPKSINWREAIQHETGLKNAFRFRVQNTGFGSVVLSTSFESPVPGWITHQQSPSWDPVNRTFLTGSYRMFMGLLVAHISTSYNRDDAFSQNMHILCGFKLTKKMYLEPWVGFIPGKDENVQFHGNDTIPNMLPNLLMLFKDTGYYETTISRLRAAYKEFLSDGSLLPNSAILTPWKLVPDASSANSEHISLPQQALRLSLSLTTVEEKDVPIHEVTVRLDPLVK